MDFVVFSIHWGSNYNWVPSERFTRLAHFVIDQCGVDLFHGHSSHHVQGIEVYKGKPIVYGCGDFVDDYAVDDDYRNDLSCVYLPTFSVNSSTKAATLETFQLVPTRIEMFRVRTLPSDDDDHTWLLSKLAALSRRYGTCVGLANALAEGAKSATDKREKGKAAPEALEHAKGKAAELSSRGWLELAW